MSGFDLARVRFDEHGLVPVVAQEATTGEVLMVAWADREALERTIATGEVHYHSRSRDRLWRKGETSGHVQSLVRLAPDCDGDAVLALVHQKGPACHTGADTCFAPAAEPPPAPVLAQLGRVLQDRRAAPPSGSYTAKLYADPRLAAKKVGEEAAELVMALTGESDERVAEEAAGVLYHVLAACQGRSVSLKSVLDVLERRRT
jgi:phosphoribosyl-AMP cyclohydrolase / phosphoribosyl-ATP pyrophosphohydrolase